MPSDMLYYSVIIPIVIIKTSNCINLKAVVSLAALSIIRSMMELSILSICFLRLK
jgi:hypothetical protein